ncbi:sugar phosphate isomerase/epimerase family protein [Lentilactobacillus sp. SPB1-3]|uniref:Sugar phosphate isomerase/epimerase family protein n=1 Tax=Lentilactobacillus terminaliae TaxID=3003483 RepID=A0ACD5DEY1_9LACO|nr:sugar phosphate isomerase/epimerase [Lentilactobacillus sp. SPB1-3]MCZ0976482.1 sugar phosphate isomerase/epimerase [Lentilactobacillus sp. SPB1-3]
MTLILNTWIFEKDVKNGALQTDLIDRVAKLGADGIEVRREYFKNIGDESVVIGNKAKENNLIVNYSVPDVVFLEDGKLNPKLPQYFEEGKTMGISKIKFNTGNFDEFKGDLVAEFNKLPINEIEMNVENDQTRVSGTIDTIDTFLGAAYQAGLTQLGYVYDLGNWAFTHGDANEAAARLSKYTHYIHLKNTIDDGNKLVTSDDLDEGVFDWVDIVKRLPKNVQYALEYPMDSDEQIAQQIKLFNTKAGD